jgi:hypothetical protein
MPRHTDARIPELCNELNMSKSESETEEILEELQKVLREHVTLARNALEGQLTSLRAMEEIANAKTSCP